MIAALTHYPSWLIAIFVFVTILASIWLGMVYRKFEIRKGREGRSGGLGSLENSMLTLLGLLLAFTFSMAVSKFEIRRTGIVQEANAIGTAILRCDLYPDSTRAILKNNFKQYVEARISYYKAGTNEAKIRSSLQEANKYSSVIWSVITGLPPTTENLIRSSQMIPAMNAVIDIVTTRETDRVAKVPPLIMIILLILTLTGSFLVGYDQSSTKRSKVFLVAFSFMSTVALYLILELDRPRSGLINLDATEQTIVDLRTMFE